jgi:hypothetical protein
LHGPQALELDGVQRVVNGLEELQPADLAVGVLDHLLGAAHGAGHRRRGHQASQQQEAVVRRRNVMLLQRFKRRKLHQIPDKLADVVIPPGIGNLGCLAFKWETKVLWKFGLLRKLHIAKQHGYDGDIPV